MAYPKFNFLVCRFVSIPSFELVLNFNLNLLPADMLPPVAGRTRGSGTKPICRLTVLCFRSTRLRLQDFEFRIWNLEFFPISEIRIPKFENTENCLPRR
ncbi:MAG: hypothetical protein EBZ78_13820 [Verrucomicrobia bacterium]|nr:hypothetical protein [Verrucomicrobiota bacterium]